AFAVDLRHAVRAEKHQTAVDDVEVVAVEGAHGRPCGAVSLGRVLAAVTRTAEPRRLRRDEPDDFRADGLHDLLPRLEDRTARFHTAAEVRTPVRDDREARLPVHDSVVADERRPSRDLA